MRSFDCYRASWITPKHLKDIQRERLLWDDGYSFAAGEEKEAASHLDAKSRSSKTLGDPTVLVLLEFTLGHYTLTIPSPGETEPLQPRDHGEHFYLNSPPILTACSHAPVTFFVSPMMGMLSARPGMTYCPCLTHDPGVNRPRFC